VIAKYIEEHDSMKKDIEQFQAQRVQAVAQELVSKARTVNGVTVISGRLGMMPNAAKDLVFKVRELVPENLVCVVGTVFDDKPMLNVMLSDDMVKDHGLNAGQLVREAAKLMQGGGGGQPHFASAGGKNSEGLSAAVDKVVELCKL
jgi:alanyl-tRNA synthetase